MRLKSGFDCWWLLLNRGGVEKVAKGVEKEHAENDRAEHDTRCLAHDSGRFLFLVACWFSLDLRRRRVGREGAEVLELPLSNESLEEPGEASDKLDDAAGFGDNVGEV